jgi:hypothetical protein
MTVSNVPFEWIVTESAAEELYALLARSEASLDTPGPVTVPEDSASEFEDASFEPLLLIAGSIAIAHLVRTVSQVVRNHKQGGVVIDSRGPKLSVREGVRGINAGTVVVINEDGPRTLTTPDPADIKEALQAL